MHCPAGRPGAAELGRPVVGRPGGVAEHRCFSVGGRHRRAATWGLPAGDQARRAGDAGRGQTWMGPAGRAGRSVCRPGSLSLGIDRRQDLAVRGRQARPLLRPTRLARRLAVTGDRRAVAISSAIRSPRRSAWASTPCCSIRRALAPRRSRAGAGRVPRVVYASCDPGTFARERTCVQPADTGWRNCCRSTSSCGRRSRADCAVRPAPLRSGNSEAEDGQGDDVRPDGKVAVVTGGSRGIGRSICEQMAAHGAKVVVSSRKLPACEEVVKGIKAKGGEATPWPPASPTRRSSRTPSPPAQGLRQDRHHGVQRRLQSLLRAADRAEGGGVRQDHAEQRHVQPVADEHGRTGDGRAEGRRVHRRVVDRRADRLGAHRGLQHEQGGRPLPGEVARWMGQAQHPGERHRARPDPDRLRQGCGTTPTSAGPTRARPRSSASASPTTSAAAVFLASKAGNFVCGQ